MIDIEKKYFTNDASFTLNVSFNMGKKSFRVRYKIKIDSTGFLGILFVIENERLRSGQLRMYKSIPIRSQL